MAETKQLETPVEREARLARERAMLAEADADLAAGRYLTGPALEEWLDAFVGEGDLPSPEELRLGRNRAECRRERGAPKSIAP